MSSGKIFLVGLGPGAEAHMSLRAREAIAEAEVVIGYTTYIQLVAPLLAGKEVIRKGMTEELDRAVEAYQHACTGRRVALISSGDSGVYGMAAPTYEVLLQAGWSPESAIEVEVVPGTTALTACAALVGAPLSHDFCSISLSDLLTPWPLIARRLEAAGRSDFVVALYNPKSGRRCGQILEAQRILLRHRHPDTPVAVVKSAYRPRQQIQQVTLATLADCDIGMLTTVLVGNSSSYRRHGLLLTPRGYANKYAISSGALKEGERAGHSLNLGLVGWRGAARAWLQHHPGAPLSEAARHFAVPLGGILSALEEAPAGESAGGYAVRALPATPPQLAATLRPWGRLRATLESGHGASIECRWEGRELAADATALWVEQHHFSLRIEAARLAQIWLVRGPAEQQGLYAVDAVGEGVCTLRLDHSEDAAEHFEQSWRQWAPPLR